MARFTKSNHHARIAMTATNSPKNTSAPTPKADAAMDVIFGEFSVWPFSA